MLETYNHFLLSLIESLVLTAVSLFISGVIFVMVVGALFVAYEVYQDWKLSR